MLTLNANAEFSTAFPQGAGSWLSPQRGRQGKGIELMGVLYKVFTPDDMLKTLANTIEVDM